MSKPCSHGSEDSERAVTSQVQEFYETFRFPGVRPLDQEGLILMRRLDRCLCSSGGNGARWRVLDAGCGTGNTTISLARRFPEADFLGVDLSASSLEIAQRTAQEEGLPNIRFRQWNLLESELNEGCFDVVLCLGVLHHTANMQSVLGNLREALSESGSLYLWVYGQHGRYRHSLNRRLLRMLMSANPPASDPVELAREFLRSGGQGAVLSDLFGKGPSSGMMEKVLAEPAWIADQFLNPNEAMLTMENLLGLVKEARLEIESWLGLPEKPFRLFGSEALIERYRRLSASEQLIALDLLLKPDRYFLVLQKIPNARVAPR